MSASRERKLRQAQGSAPLTEKEKETAKQAKSLKAQTIAFTVICVLMVAVLLAYGVLSTGILEKTTTALVVGEHKLTPAEMNYYYVNAAHNYYNSSDNASFIQYLISPNAPVDKQVLNSETGETWADQFINMAIADAKNSYAIYDQAMADGFQLDETQQSKIDSAVSSIDGYAALTGASSANAYLRSLYGRGCNLENYRSFLTVQQTIAAYTAQYRDSIDCSPEKMAEFEAKDPTRYNSYDFRYYFIAINDYYEGTDPTDEVRAQAQADAKAAADEMASLCEGKEDTFILHANRLHKESVGEGETSDYDAATDTLRKDTFRDGVNTTLASWIMDESRVSGETTVIPSVQENDDGTEKVVGYYVAMFLDGRDNSQIATKNVRHILFSGTDDETKAKAEAMLAEFAKDPTEENFAALANENSTDGGSNTNGGLYENIVPGQMVPSFDAWCFDEANKPGDYGIVETEYGFHLMYMVGDGISYRDSLVAADLRNSTYEDWYKEITDAYTAERASGMSFVHTSIYLKQN